MMNRRDFLIQSGSSAVVGAAMLALSQPTHAADTKPVVKNGRHQFQTRGVVLTTKDLAEVNWPQLANRAALNTIGTHISPSEVTAFVKRDEGQRFLEDCKRLGIAIEHELHAINDLLPRDLFQRNPEMFRMDQEGNRVKEFNCCVHSPQALEVICANAVKYSRLLPSTTGRYFYWIDDIKPMCHCPKCRGFSDSDQALILENAIVAALRAFDPRASLAHLCYVGTFPPPTQVVPVDGVFLEFAPIERRWTHALADTEVVGQPLYERPQLTHGQTLDYLDANLEVFPRETAQVLEYWLDVSRHCLWKRPGHKLDWYPEVFRSDVDIYAKRGIRHITSFAAWIDGDYVQQFGEPTCIDDYGKVLAGYQ